MIENTIFFIGFLFATILIQSWPCFDIAKKFIDADIVPDVIPVPPHEMCTVIYHHEGNNTELTGGDLYMENYHLCQEPTVKWKADEKKFYLLALINPDLPNRTYPIFNGWNEWLVGNIPGERIEFGEQIFAFLSPDGKREYDTRRHVFLIYEQPKKLYFDEDRCDNKTGQRSLFKIYTFAQKYKLGDPIYGNFYYSVD